MDGFSVLSSRWGAVYCIRSASTLWQDLVSAHYDNPNSSGYIINVKVFLTSWKRQMEKSPPLSNEKHKSPSPLDGHPPVILEGKLKDSFMSRCLYFPHLLYAALLCEKLHEGGKKAQSSLQIAFESRVLSRGYDPNKIEMRLSCWMLLAVILLFPLQKSTRKSPKEAAGHVFLLTA